MQTAIQEATGIQNTREESDVDSEIIAVHVHLDEVGEGVVDVGSFRQEKATAWTHVVKEEQLLVLCRHVHKEFMSRKSF